MTDWQTPRGFFDHLDSVCHFAVDAAANESNHLLPSWYGPNSPLGEDALTVPKWLSPAWCNPPYGSGIEKWLDKFVEQRGLGNIIVALLPARVETRWWYEKVINQRVDVMMLVGRVPFEHPTLKKKTQPDHASALLIYGPENTGRVTWVDWKRAFAEKENK